MEKKIGILGGTFDPPHKGHTGLAKELLAKCGLSKIIFVPAPNPPHKPDLPIAPFKDRLEMLKLAVDALPEFEISTIEADREGPSYTYYTLEHFSAAYPNTEIYLIIGSDNLFHLHKWHRALEIVKKWNVLVYHRSKAIPGVKEIETLWPQPLAAKLLNSITNLADFNISSTKIRNNMKYMTNCGDFLEERVYNYIVENKLYR